MTDRRISKDRRKDPQLVTIQDAMKLVRVSRRTLYNWMIIGKIEWTQIINGHRRIVKNSLFKK